MEHEIRTALEGFTTRLRTAVDAELDSLATELMQGAEAADQRARTLREATLAEAEAAALRREEAAIGAAREAALVEADSAAARASEREARLAAVERLLASVRSIDACATLRETLEVLVQSASLETPRVAVLLIEGNTVRPFAQRGFEEIPASGPIAAGGVVEACVRDGQPAFTGDAAGLKAPGFAGLSDDRAGFAVPLRVGSRTVAVLYADDAADAEHDAPAAWPEALELLARHASLHLENLTAVKSQATTGSSTRTGSADEARRYARLLISEIKLYNESSVREGRAQKDLRRRLGTEIDRAERAYRERIPETLPDRDQYFETELVATLADGDASIL